MKTSFKIYPSITGRDNIDWQNKIEEIDKFKLQEVAVFLGSFDKKERDHLFKFLTKSSIKKIPFVHLRHDSSKEEIEFFIKNYNTECFNIHEDGFHILKKWAPYYDRLYLELNFDNKLHKNVKVRKIGGFCIDLSHLKASIARGTKEAEYIFSRKDKISFSCNHLNGYDPFKRKDKHLVTSLEDFDYLTTLPKFVFGKIIAIEVYNSIKEQLEFKEYLEKILLNHLN
jgi:hypothetical protein